MTPDWLVALRKLLDPAAAVAADAETMRAAAVTLLDHLEDLALREQWVALYDDGSWVEGEDRGDAEQLVDRSPVTPAPRLARRWVSDWQLAEEVEQS